MTGKVPMGRAQHAEIAKDLAEQIASGTCTYHPDTNIIGGDPNQATATASDRDKEKTLLGWIDIEKLVSDASSAEGG